MRKEYLKELEELKEKMKKAEKFAKRFPIFEKYIIDNKITGESGNIKFGERYENLRLNWGINRYYYKDNNDITNCKEDYQGFLFNIYFNSCSLFDSNNDYDLEKLKDIKGVFFFDRCNSTFYIKDEGIEEFLKEAVKRYDNALIIVKAERVTKRKEELEKELEKLNKN